LKNNVAAAKKKFDEVNTRTETFKKNAPSEGFTNVTDESNYKKGLAALEDECGKSRRDARPG
jgi:hypothetical protein